jgi:hypothetical protein
MRPWVLYRKVDTKKNHEVKLWIVIFFLNATNSIQNNKDQI